RRLNRCSSARGYGDNVSPSMSQLADGRKEVAMWTSLTTAPVQPSRTVDVYVHAIETRRPVVIPDMSTTDLIPREWMEAFGHKSFMAVPLFYQDAAIGVMSLDYRDQATPFERWQVELAMAIGSQLALTIENTRLYGEAQERLGETRTLLSVAQVLSQPTPSGEVMRRLARVLAHAF